MEIQKGMYGLPQAGIILTIKLLKQHLTNTGYYETPVTPRLWKHVHRPITFSLVVDNFGIKYIGEEHFHHLVDAIKEEYNAEIYETKGHYCGINSIGITTKGM